MGIVFEPAASVDETALASCGETVPSVCKGGCDACYSMRFANCTLGSCVVLSVVEPYTNALPEVI